jgi:hypothetical protein
MLFDVQGTFEQLSTCWTVADGSSSQVDKNGHKFERIAWDVQLVKL